jgi:hypothetical protein
MAKTVILDEIHLTFRIPNDLPDDQADTIRQTLAGDDFMSRLRKAFGDVIRAFPELAVARVSLTR